MSVALQIDLKDNVTPAIAKLAEKVKPNRLAQIVVEPLRIFWRDRLKSLGTNKRGWPSTGFWEQAARATTGLVSGDSAILSCHKQGVRQRFYGGHIAPVNAGAMTIPISPVSYGHSAGDFPGLFMIKTPKGAYLVQLTETVSSPRLKKGEKKALGGNSARRQRASLNFLFKLSSGVDQQADPSVVPSGDEFAEVAMGAIQKELAT